MGKLEETLKQIEKKPGMYLGGRRSLRLVEAFITGYQCGSELRDDTLPFTHFTRWVAAHYRVNDGAMNGFCLILEHVDGSDQRAFDEFFRLLPEYAKDVAEVGLDGIHARYVEVMNRRRKRRGSV
jgi:hypothetical protein